MVTSVDNSVYCQNLQFTWEWVWVGGDVLARKSMVETSLNKSQKPWDENLMSFKTENMQETFLFLTQERQEQQE